MKPKILFILHTPPPIHGSSIVGKYIQKSIIINEAFECRYINLGTSLTVDEIGKNILGKIWRYLSMLLQVIKQLILFKPSLCYLAITAKGVGFYKDALVAILVKIFNVKLVYHFHNKGVNTRQHLAFDNMLYRFVFKGSEVILLSKYLYSDIKKYFSEEQVHYCPNGIPDSLDKKLNKKEKGKNEKVEILFLSNLLETKGVFILLQACNILQTKLIPFHCTFVGGIGDVNEQKFMSRVDELGLGSFVNYAGKKYGLEKEEAFMSADIFAFPTYQETFGLVNLEAMQFSLPVVSTYEGGIPDIIEDGVTGFLVPQKDVAALAEKLEILINSPKLRIEMGTAGHAKYEKQFTLSIFENKLYGILDQITSHNC